MAGYSKQTGWREFLRLCQEADSVEALDKLLRMHLTPEEQEDISTRCLIFRELLKGEKTQRDMAKTLGISIAKITQGSNALKSAGNHLKQVLERVFHLNPQEKKMFHKLTEENFLSLAQDHNRVVVFKEVLGDQITPVQAFQVLRPLMKGATLLESHPKEKDAGRYSFLGFTLLAQLSVKNKTIQVHDESGIHTLSDAPLKAIRDFYKARQAPMLHPLSGFSGSIVGFFSYDAAELFEEKLQNNLPQTNLSDILFKSYQDHILFDQETGQVVLATLAINANKNATTQELKKIYEDAIKRLDNFYEKLTTPSNASLEAVPKDVSQQLIVDGVQTLTEDDAYIAAAQKAQQHIHAGDAFQIVLARTFETNFNANPFDIYRVLRYRNPSPYMFYFDNDDTIILGASPEKMMSVKDNIMQSCPLAGTRPRGSEYNDQVQADDLLSDAKEVSEHMMLVDLARNDMGAVARPGSVRVKILKEIKKFSHVMHISSTVEAPLADGKDALDGLQVAFPAGTLSGAPKIRAMQIIAELEGQRRQLYGGVIGFFNHKGDFESCIAIRMAILKNGVASVTAGAGIVADSNLQKEADETRHKARAVLEAIAHAEREFT